jgi:hypothetical protein
LIPRNDAWTLARLVVGHYLNGELLALSSRFQDIARDLIALPPEDRQAVWDAFQDGQADRAEIILALAAVDPEGTPPEASPQEGSTARNGVSPEPTPINYPTLATGTLLMAVDQGNYGWVDADLGDSATVHFRNPETGAEATVELSKSQLRWPDGRPLTEPEVIRPGVSPADVALDGRFATLADIDRMIAEQTMALAVLDRPRRASTRWQPSRERVRPDSGSTWPAGSTSGMPWPDGQANELPKETRTLWVQADQASLEMREADPSVRTCLLTRWPWDRRPMIPRDLSTSTIPVPWPPSPCASGPPARPS